MLTVHGPFNLWLGFRLCEGERKRVQPMGPLVEQPRPGARFFPIEPQREDTGSL
jgi:hypothetical protein